MPTDLAWVKNSQPNLILGLAWVVHMDTWVSLSTRPSWSLGIATTEVPSIDV